MASKRTIAGMLAFLHELYPTREIGKATAQAWAITFADWDDEVLETSVRAAAATPGRRFFPTPGEIAEYRTLPTVDASALLRRISALGSYTSTGWRYPALGRVRDELGEAVANAYAAAGAERCFADDGSVTQDIARRAFAEELKSAQARQPSVPLLPPGSGQRALSPGQRLLGGDRSA